ncbi:MAG: hypothetical protein COA74_15625 [Gammaproteobacteria bacterium]|nr:MAG: hypothetical protein COA74_15625 [Gammaproteobacteria bacterium]
MAYQSTRKQTIGIEILPQLLVLLVLLGFTQTKSTISAAEKEEVQTEQSENQAEQEEPIVSQSLRNDRIIASQLREGEVKWLKTGDDEFLGIYKGDTSGKALGSILILPSSNAAPNAPGALSYLAEKLSTKGWHTLAISLPEFNFSGPAPEFPQEKTSSESEQISQTNEAEDTENSEKGVNTQPTEAILPDSKQWYEKQQTRNMEKLLERVLVAEAELRALDGKYVILAQGTTADLLLELISSRVIKAEGLIIINIQYPVDQMSSKIANKLAAVTIPLLDIYNLPASKAASKRMSAQKSKSYRQLYVPGNGIHYRGSEPMLYKRIWGWLKKNFSG